MDRQQTDAYVLSAMCSKHNNRLINIYRKFPLIIDAKVLSSSQTVESLREKVYATLDEHCKQQYPDEPGRFAKLLLRLPALRSIGLKCTDHLFTSKLVGDMSIESFLLDALESPSVAI